jgi:hypothetical protein
MTDGDANEETGAPKVKFEVEDKVGFCILLRGDELCVEGVREHSIDRCK